MDRYDRGEPGGQRHHDQQHAPQRGAAIRFRRERRRSEHHGNAQSPGQRRRAGRVEVNAHAQDQRERVVGDVVGASSGGFLARVVQQEADRQRRCHDQLESQVDHARTDTGDPAEQDIVREPRLRVGENHPNAPQRVADIDDGEAEQHGNRRGGDNHGRHRTGATHGVHGDPRRRQDSAAHGDLSDQRHGEGARVESNRAGPNEHRGNHDEHAQDGARQDKALARGRGNKHIQPGQKDQHGAHYHVGPAEGQRRGRKPEASHDGEQQRPMRPSA